MHGRRWPLFAVFLVLAGCVEEPPHDAPAPQTTTAPGATFDPDASGTIAGRVVWHGPPPDLPLYKVRADPENLPPDGTKVFDVPNPYAPPIDADGGMGDVVVFLRGVDPARAGPWTHGPALIEQRDRRLHVAQDGHASRVGFVQRGGEMAAVNYDHEYHALRVRGAAFLNLPFVEADTVTRRRLEHPGLVELLSGTSYFWMHAKLLVVEHPYYARTQADGRFRLEQVPEGRYEIVCWMPNWKVLRKERDSESGLICRLVFAPALEKSSTVEVRRGAVSEACFLWDRTALK